MKVIVTASLQKGGVPAAPSGTATLLRLSPNYQFYPRTLLAVTYFRYPRLSWLDGRCVQGPGTYSPRHGWCAITSESSFTKSGCRLRSELREAFGISILSPGSGLLYPHCNTCVAPDVRAVLIWRHPHLPHILRRQSLQSPQHNLLVTEDKGCARYGT